MLSISVISAFSTEYAGERKVLLFTLRSVTKATIVTKATLIACI